MSLQLHGIEGFKLMSRIQSAFQNGKALVAFLTVGDPTKEATIRSVLLMEQAGVDLIQLGIPFSDPTAEETQIQESNLRALRNGMTVDEVFAVIKEIREKSNVPLLLYSYLNPVFHYGYERFFSRCGELSVDAVEIADLPFEEKEEVSLVAKKNEVDIISVIASSKQKRIAQIAKEATGFLHIIPAINAYTGIALERELEKIMVWIRKETKIPAIVDLDIRIPEQAKLAAWVADGAFVLCPYIALDAWENGQADGKILQYMANMKNTLQEC